MTNYIYLGYGTTGSDGVAHLDHDADGEPIDHSYTGSGVGEVDVVASLDDPSSISDSSLQSETYEVHDCMAFDSCVDNSKESQWYHSPTGEVSYAEDGSGMIIDHQATGLNTSGIKTPNASGAFCFSGSVALEFDVVSITGIFRMQFYDNTSVIQLTNDINSLNFGDNTHIKLVYDNNTKKCTPYVNGVQKSDVPTDTGNALTDYVIRFRLQQATGGTTLKIKNVEVYTI